MGLTVGGKLTGSRQHFYSIDKLSIVWLENYKFVTLDINLDSLETGKYDESPKYNIMKNNLVLLLDID